MIFQDPYQSLNPYFSVYDSVSEPLIVHNVGNSETRKDMVRESLNSVGLAPPDDFFYRYPHQMSGGQRQRIAIARAMVLKPEFVVADEPTSMLDASIAIHIFNILSELRKKLNVTFLFITHSLAAARYLCDRIAVIYKGELVEIGLGGKYYPESPATRIPGRLSRHILDSDISVKFQRTNPNAQVNSNAQNSKFQTNARLFRKVVFLILFSLSCFLFTLLSYLFLS